MKRKTIAVDVDDVLASSVGAWLDFSNRTWGTNLTIEEYNEDWATMWQLDQAATRARRDTIIKSGLHAQIEPHANAAEVLQWLAQRYDLVITSSRVGDVHETTRQWLEQYFPGIFKDIHLTGFYDGTHKEPAKMTKAEICRQVGADFLIDDHPKHCLAVAEAGITSLLFGEYPWSRHVTKLPKKVVRVKNWLEVMEYFRGL